ncbi:MAG: hypothetical protein ACR2LL_11840 [Nitrosopumilus sp.]|uniref:hypothetical protein n=1 Tax=Nitrosopumilus sp. TaxID=2024843 RepID=UPI00292D08CB|nr:hypothetical protein [Nitrosopumilus sp.]
MRKEFVVKSINSSPDSPPHIIVSLASAKDMQEGNRLQSKFDPSKINPANMNDMMKDLNKMLSGMGGGGMMPGGSGTSLKLDMHEYKEMNLSVGDKVYLELTKDENLGI